MRVIDANEVDVVSCCFFNVDAKGFWRRRISGSSDIETFRALGEFLRPLKRAHLLTKDGNLGVLVL